MNMTATYAGSSQIRDTSHYEVQEQSDGTLCFQTYPASKPVFTFDSMVIIAGFAVPVLTLDYFLLGIGNYTASLVTSLMAVGVAWLCLRVLHRERRHGVRPCRFYVSNVSINIPPAKDSQEKSTLLLAGNIDRLIIRSTIDHTETTSYGFGHVGSKGAQARDKRTAWFSSPSSLFR
jgi:hypothetical protein